MRSYFTEEEQNLLAHYKVTSGVVCWLEAKMETVYQQGACDALREAQAKTMASKTEAAKP